MSSATVRISPKLNIASLKKFGLWWNQYQKNKIASLSTQANKHPKAA